MSPITTTVTQVLTTTHLPHGTLVAERDVKKDNTKPPARSRNIGRINAKDYAKPSPTPEVLQSKRQPADTIPSNGTLSKSDSSVKRAGNYILGPKQGNSPVKCIQQYLARRDGTDEFYVLKILTRKDAGEKETLLHTEHSLLSLVKNEEGVIHEHGMFRETVKQPVVDAKGNESFKEVRRLCLVLDCFVAHDFSPKYSNITNMQCYVIKEKKLPEAEAIRIFCKVVQIVERLHKLNIVHRDLKLGNIILNKDTREVTLSNFCLGKHLSSNNDLLKDQRGSPAYISPDVISGKPYLGKPSDMWALGVVLYTMLFGQFPFYDQSPTELFRKIKLGEFQIPVDVNVSEKTVELIKSLLLLDPKKRLTASDTLVKVKSIISEEQTLMTDSDLQVVPDCHPGAERPKKRTFSERCSSPADFAADIASILAKCEESAELMVNDFEPKTKKVKAGKLPELIDQFTLDDEQLQRIHAVYVARKIAEAASLGKLSAQMITEELANQFSSNSSNGLIKSAATNTDSARVPDGDVDNASVINPATRAGGSESKSAVVANRKGLKQKPNNSATFLQFPQLSL